MKQIECWQVDLWDGGDRVNFGFYLDLSVKKEDIEKAHPHCMVTRKLIVIYDSLQEREENTPRAVRRRIWDKLDAQERIELGLRERP
jgi:hypothetical protein